MSLVKCILPKNPEVKAAIRLVLMFTEVQYFCYDEKYLPDVGLLQINTLQEVQEMNIVIRDAVQDEELEVSNRFILMLYAFIGISNKVLVSSNDEATAEVFLQFFPKDLQVTNFAQLRNMIFFVNNYLTQAIEEFAPFIDGYNDMKEWLNNLEIE